MKKMTESPISWIVGLLIASVAATTYIHTAFASNTRVDKVEAKFEKMDGKLDNILLLLGGKKP